MKRVVITGWHPGLNKVGLTKLLRSEAAFLSEAKQAVDSILDGKTVTLELTDGNRAKQVAQSIATLGAVCRIEHPATAV